MTNENEAPWMDRAVDKWLCTMNPLDDRQFLPFEQVQQAMDTDYFRGKNVPKALGLLRALFFIMTRLPVEDSDEKCLYQAELGRLVGITEAAYYLGRQDALMEGK